MNLFFFVIYITVQLFFVSKCLYSSYIKTDTGLILYAVTRLQSIYVLPFW